MHPIRFIGSCYCLLFNFGIYLKQEVLVISRFLIIFIMFAAIAYANSPQGMNGRWKTACNEDVQRFCKHINPGQVGIIKCLRVHNAELSTPCRAEINSERERACRADHEEFCNDIKFGQGDAEECLKQHKNELTPECKEHLIR